MYINAKVLKKGSDQLILDPHIPEWWLDDYQSSEIVPIFSLILAMLYNFFVKQT